MDPKFKQYISIAIVVLVAFLGFWHVKSYSRSVVPVRTFSVQGEGKIVAIPDIAEVYASILSEGDKNLDALQKDNTEKSNRVIAFLKKNGVDKKDIKTTNYSITPRYQRYSCERPVFGRDIAPCPPPEIVGYSIRQDILVKIRDLSKVGTIIAGVVQSGANTISGPNFTIDEPEKIKNEARAKAVKDAQKKAKTIARAGNFRLGKPVSINEGFGPIISPRFFAESAVKDVSIAGMPTPSIEPGSQEIIVNVNITYEIK